MKKLNRLRQRAGKVRDRDVLISNASTVHPDGEDQCVVELLEHLGAQRSKQASKFHGAVQKNGSKIRRQLWDISSELDKVLPPRRTSGADSASANAAATALKLSSELASPARLNRNNLHPYRLRVKELRNVLQSAEQIEKPEFVDELGEVKDAIGEWHDWQELVGVAEKALNHGPTCRLVRELKRITDAKFEKALARAENLRKEYLRGSHRGKGQDRKPSKRVWEATSALAA